MVDKTSRVNVEKLISLADDLVVVLKNSRDNDILMQSCAAAKSLRDSCEEEFHVVRNSLEEYEKKVSSCMKKISEVENQTIPEEQLDALQKEAEDEKLREISLRQELRKIKDQMGDMDLQQISLEERKAKIKTRDKGLLKSQHMLSMCASATSVVPDLDVQTMISGYIVDKDKKRYEKFKFPPTSSPFEVCNSLWEKVGQ